MAAFYLLTGLLFGAYVLGMVLCLAGWMRTPVFHSEPAQFKTKASILLPVRNEEKNIARILRCLSRQAYPASLYEIIVIDDHSADSTAALVREQNIPNAVLRMAAGEGKKNAITEGIQYASGTLVITTDADCEMGEHWLSELVSYYEKYHPVMIIGPVLLQGERTLQEKIQSQEMTVLTALAGASAHFGRPLLCSGANLAYERETFSAVNGFAGTEHTPSGDDVFLMLKMQRQFPGRIHYLKSEQAAVHTRPAASSAEAIRQRKRWASKTFLFGFSYVACIAVLVFGVNFLVLISGILSVINVKFVLALITTLPLKCIVDFMLFQSASSFFRKQSYPVLFLLSSALYPLYASVVGVLSPFTNTTWKGRQS